jgi:hypothetical protein
MTTVQKIEKLEARKANLVDVRDEYVLMGHGLSVMMCNGLIAECDEKIARLSKKLAPAS